MVIDFDFVKIRPKFLYCIWTTHLELSIKSPFFFFSSLGLFSPPNLSVVSVKEGSFIKSGYEGFRVREFEEQ